MNRLCEPIFANAKENDDCRSTAMPLLDNKRTDLRAAVQVALAEVGSRFLGLFGSGLAKWFLHLARGKSWDMMIHHPFCYSTMPNGDERPSMVCLAIEFVPPSPWLKDEFRVVHGKPAAGPQHRDTSIRAAEKIGGMANADSGISTNGMLRARLVENLRNLLEEAGYDRAVLADIEA